MQAKEIYQKCENTRWYRPCLEMIAEDYNLSYVELLDLIKKYILEELKEEETKFEELLKQIKAREIFADFLNFSLKRPEDYPLAEWYYKEKANRIEQQTFEKIVLFIGKSVYLELLKNTQAIDIITKRFNLSIIEVKKFYQFFCEKKLTNKMKEKLNRTLEGKKTLSAPQNKPKNIKKSKFYKLCNMLLADIPIEEILNYIHKNKLTLRQFYPKFVESFLSLYQLEKDVDMKKTEERILTRYQEVIDLIREEKKLDNTKERYLLEEIKEAKRVLTRIIYDERQVELPNNINEILQIVRRYDPKLSQLYFGIINIDDSIIKLIEYLKYGYQNRPFDLLDYYLEIKIPQLKIREQLNKIPEEAKLLIERFFVTNRIIQVNPEVLLKNNLEFYCKLDKNRIPISNTGIELTEEEKERVLNFLIQNNVPLSLNLFNLAVQRYLNKDLYIEESKRI